MSHRKTLLAASIIAGLCLAGTLQAQDANQNTAPRKEKAKELATITVTGIRDSEAESLALKKDAASHVEVVTAEDIGKLPAKNVADTLQRLPGVSVGTSSAGEGGFDENDRVSLRGTNPSMTQTLINGHNIGTGDWFVLNQTATVGRSVSYSLLPAEIVNEVVVHKTSEARFVEGGAAGTVDIITRKPLEFAKPVTAEASVGGVYADLPSSTKPQFSGLFNYRNDASTFGVMAQAFYEERSLQRNGQEILGLNQLKSTDAIVAAHPDLNGVYYPSLLGSALFTQKRTRKGGSIDVQFKPADNVSVNLDGFISKLNADNYNRNYMLWGNHFIPGATNLNPGYTVSGNTLTNASFAAVPGDTTNYGIYDLVSRKASSSTKFFTADVDWKVTDMLDLKFQAGTTKGEGNSPKQDVLELNTSPGTGANWGFRGTGKPANWGLGPDNSSPAASGVSANWIFGEGGINVQDKEKWGQFDGELDFDGGALESLQFGARYTDHTRENDYAFAQGPNAGFDNPANFPQGFQHYPGDFNSSLGGSFPQNIWYYSQADLAAYDSAYANRGADRLYPNDIYKVNEKTSAVYLQFNWAGEGWSGNLGGRFVKTKEDIGYTSNTPQEPGAQGPILGSAFFPAGYYFNNYKHDYSKFLPSGNLKFDLSDQLVLRLAASQTLTRPDYSALAGTVSLDDLGHTGSGGNPHLKPLLSSNFDASLEWYFAPRGLLSAGVYDMALKNYVNFAVENRSYLDMQASSDAGQDVYSTYQVSIPSNTNGKVRGVELNYQQPFGDYLGMALNYTYANGHASNDQPLQGTSKNTANASAYFENDSFNARVTYTYRSSYYAGPDRAGFFYLGGTGYLSASLGYKVNDWMSVSLDALNLNNPTLKYYVKAADYSKQPRAFYTNGRQYYLTLRFKF
ncbi:MAG: TonB-dependent receptor [Dyella sp.]|uniref:TonB-dependent receptor n=1 Tax=Dyella sp. TaxID=1869338 RepID=UPI003F7F66A6